MFCCEKKILELHRFFCMFFCYVFRSLCKSSKARLNFINIISSLSSLSFPLPIYSGIDVKSLLSTLGFSADIIQSKLAAGTSTFVMSYAVHKVFAPVRIGITLTCTPFIVRYLRGIGLLKRSLPTK